MYKTLGKYASIRNLFCKLCKVMSSVLKFQDTAIRQKIDLLNQIGDRHSIKYTQLKISTMICKRYIFNIKRRPEASLKGRISIQLSPTSDTLTFAFPKSFPTTIFHKLEEAGVYTKSYTLCSSQPLGKALHCKTNVWVFFCFIFS